jgi:hypothetical protein
MKSWALGMDHGEANWKSATSSWPIVPRNAFSFDVYCLFEKAPTHLSKPRVVGIELAPGKVLHMLERHLSAYESAYDYAESGCAATRDFLYAKEVSVVTVCCQDVLLELPECIDADCAYSIGVEELFDDPSAMVIADLSPLMMGGRAIIILPKYSVLAGQIQGISDLEKLGIHNFNPMQKSFLDFYFTHRTGFDG